MIRTLRWLLFMGLIVCHAATRSDILDTLKAQSKNLQEKASQFASSVLNRSFPHKNDVARVRTGTSLSDAETAFRAAREPIIRIGLGKILGKEITEPRLPTIGICMSGGGYRAMLLSMAFMGGLQKLGVLDAAMYAAALSGSTWSLLYWLASGKTSRGSLNTLIETAGRGQVLSPREWADVLAAVSIKKTYGQEVTPVDVWGAYLVEQVLSDVAGQQEYVFSHLTQRVSSGQVPFPIGTTVSDNIVARSTQYQWFECSPFEFGSSFLQAWVPTWAVGRTFDKGVSTNVIPEQTLGFWMGVFGSAFSISVGDIIDKAPGFVNSDTIQKLLTPHSEPLKTSVGAKRVLNGAIIPNIAYGLSTAPAVAQPVKELELVDAGFASNLPVIPLIRPERGLDIIIMCDASSPIAGGIELKAAQKYAGIYNFKLPAIDYTVAGWQPVSVFGDPANLATPVIIYIPAINNKKLAEPHGNFDIEAATSLTGFANTIQFKYSKENADRMTGYFEQNVIAQKDIIKDVIALRLKALNKQS